MDKQIVLPGEKIAEGRFNIPGAFIDGGSTYAAVVGMMDAEGHYVPLESRYRPVVGDVVIGIVTDVRHAGYEVDLNLPEGGFIPTRDVRISLQLGDFVICRVKSVSEVGDVDLGEVRRLPLGKIVEFPSAKVPRLIGRKSSMLVLLKEHAGGDIMVGNNGLVWISEKSNIPLLLKAISLIDRKAHKSGLTDEVANMLSKESGITSHRSRDEPRDESGDGYGGTGGSGDFNETSDANAPGNSNETTSESGAGSVDPTNEDLDVKEGENYV